MDGYSVFKDILFPSSTLIIGFFIRRFYEKRKGKQEKLDAIDAHIVSLINAAENGTVYIARFYLNALLRASQQFCSDYQIKIDIDPELADLSIACTSGTLDKELATSASINLINKIKNAV